jgi:phage/conjugal plasmid C-4 type zinc finger TraR family protein
VRNWEEKSIAVCVRIHQIVAGKWRGTKRSFCLFCIEMADEIDLAQANDEFFLNLALGEHNRRAARQRLPDPEGIQPDGLSICVDCGGHIPEARKKVLPYCRRCRACQQEVENAYSHRRFF